jgi:hypothetical protein
MKAFANLFQSNASKELQEREKKKKIEDENAIKQATLNARRIQDEADAKLPKLICFFGSQTGTAEVCFFVLH